MSRNKKITLGEIFRKYGPLYREAFQGRIPLHHLKVMNAIEICRTSALGSYVYKCDECGELHFAYESCGNRHCPQCQSLKAEQWVFEKKKDLLPVQYFHVVFTIPAQLNPIMIRNQKVTYDILFNSVSQTLQELSRDEKYLGANIGFFSILHTWGQNLMDHPHIHCVVTGGGLSDDKSKWISSRKNFFIPVKVLSKRFRSIFLTKLKTAKKSGDLKFPGTICELSLRHNFQKLIDKLFKCEWVVFSKRPFKKPETVLEYLSRYAYKVAISNHRIIKVEDDHVYFKYKDYKDDSKKKIMRLNAFEFIRRFLLHILPERFMKIRYYGLLANKCREKNLSICRDLLGVKATETDLLEIYKDWKKLYGYVAGEDVFCCPHCKKGKLVFFKDLSSRGSGRSP